MTVFLEDGEERANTNHAFLKISYGLPLGNRTVHILHILFLLKALILREIEKEGENKKYERTHLPVSFSGKREKYTKMKKRRVQIEQELWNAS